MTKKIVVMVNITFMITLHVAAMLVKIPKQSISKTLWQRHFCANKKTDKKKKKNWSWKQDALLYHAIELDDVKTAGLLLKTCKRLKGEHFLIEDAQSLNMMRLLEKHGCNIRKIDNEYGGNYLHNVIVNEGTNNTKRIKDSFIKYALSRKVDPHTVDNFGENLWHKLVSRPFHFNSEEDHLLRRAKLLRSLHVDPYHINHVDKSAAYLVLDKMNDWEDRYRYARHSDYSDPLCQDTKVDLFYKHISL